MIFRFIWVGRTKDKNWLALQNDYLQRLSHFVRTEIVEIRDSGRAGGKNEDGKRILEKLNQTSFVCLMDVSGKAISSQDLASTIEKWQNAGHKEISFIICGAEGATSDIAERANLVLSLSFMTFTHEMARVVMLEQIYRAFTIINGFPYQK
jgi:23S rRNA (pseudouridine1915-N3)-methyltransferase